MRGADLESTRTLLDYAVERLAELSDRYAALSAENPQSDCGHEFWAGCIDIDAVRAVVTIVRGRELECERLAARALRDFMQEKPPTDFE